MTYSADALYALLPATIRARDLAIDAKNPPLQSLLKVVAEQTGVVERNLFQSYEDLFVETCSGWAVSYIGDLVGTTPLFDSGRVVIDTAPYADLVGPVFTMVDTLRSRADVAKTISYRRRKATRPMLEELARDVTGWAAHAVEMFQRLRWTQWIRNHVRESSFGTPDLRSAEALDRMNGPFDPTTRSVDVRLPSSADGWYQVPNVAFFLWRLSSFEVNDVSARPVAGAGDWRYSMSPLGNPTQLFAPDVRENLGSAPLDETRLPAPIRRKALAADLAAYASASSHPGFTAYYGNGFSFRIVKDGTPVPPENVRCIPLDTWCQPKGNVVGVDPVTGRMAFGTTFVPAQSVDVYFHQGFSAPIGGGSYDRAAWLARLADTDPPPLTVAKDPALGTYSTLGAAIAAWASAPTPKVVISIEDSRTYEEAVALVLPGGADLTIQASSGVRPHLRLTSTLTVGGAADASLTLSGLLIEGAVHVTDRLGALRIFHTTLVPGVTRNADGSPGSTNPSLTVDDLLNGAIINDTLAVSISSSIVGPLRIPADVKSLWIADSIVDGVGTLAISSPTTNPPPPPPAPSPFGPPTTLTRVTLFGETLVRQLATTSEVLFADKVTVERRQVGCVRFSFVPSGSTAPRRFRCQPDLEIATEIDAQQKALGRTLTPAESTKIQRAVQAWLTPTFTSERYGDAAYAQLAVGCPGQITTGAEDGSEMGVFAQLKQPQREQNLRTRLTEYLPLGLTGVIIFVT